MKAAFIVLTLAVAAPLVARQTLAASSSSSSSTSITTSTTLTSNSLIRLKANRLRRPESCRESLPRKSEDLPALVITGRVKEVYIAGEGSGNNSSASALSGVSQVAESAGSQNKALVSINRVIKGNQQLVGSDIIISGFNSSSSSPCPNYVKPNDTYILLLTHEGERKYAIQGNNILSLNLNNLDRVNAVASDEAYKRRPPIEDILCEAHYCAYGRCVVNEKNQTSCQCPESCSPLPAPVCGSDNATYTNECHLIKEGCRRQRPLFVTKETNC